MTKSVCVVCMLNSCMISPIVYKVRGVVSEISNLFWETALVCI